MDTTRVPHVDATSCASITTADVAAFRDAGLLVGRGVPEPLELDALRTQTERLVRWAVDENPEDPDVRYAQHDVTGERVPYRIEYVIDKTRAAKVLLAHPF